MTSEGSIRCGWSVASDACLGGVLMGEVAGRSGERLHAMDALRAGALFLGVVFHATMSFFPNPASLAQDRSQSTALAYPFLIIHIFRMSLFFLVAGFFAAQMLQSRGPRQFFNNRMRRIMVPLLAFWPFLFVTFYELEEWARRKGSPASSTHQTLSWHSIPLFHTWFLYDLLIFYVTAYLLDRLIRWADRRVLFVAPLDRLLARTNRLHLLPLVLALPLFLVFLFGHGWIVNAGIPTPNVGLAPNVTSFIGYFTAFGFGWLLRRHIGLLSIWKSFWFAYLGAGAVLTATILVIITDTQASGGGHLATLLPRTLVAIVYPLAIWTLCFGLLGIAQRYLARPQPVIRYLADSSFWVYLLHLPLLVALQLAVSQWPIGWYFKFPLILAVAMALLISSYHLFVRYTWVGAWLNGRRQMRPSLRRQSRDSQSQVR